jgi:hypothetical protein
MPMFKPFNNSEVTCKDVLHYICEQFGDDDGSDRCLEVKRHLENCPDCTHYCDSLETMIGLYRAASPEFSSEAKSVLLNSLGLDPSSDSMPAS